MKFFTSLTNYLIDYTNKNSLGSKFRIKRIAPMMNLIEAASIKYGSVNIVDVGGTELYWNIVSREFFDRHKVTITIVNLPGSEIPANHGPFIFVAADGCNLSAFDNEAFHIAHSNSVIEHVGDWARKVQFATELSRVAKQYFIQTPSYWFPIEPHCMFPFFHWLPKPIRVSLVASFNLGNWERAQSIDEAVRIVESARLVDKKMFQALFKDATIITERFIFLPKSFVAIKK
jgi:hypothetical protein